MQVPPPVSCEHPKPVQTSDAPGIASKVGVGWFAFAALLLVLLLASANLQPPSRLVYALVFTFGFAVLAWSLRGARAAGPLPAFWLLHYFSLPRAPPCSARCSLSLS